MAACSILVVEDDQSIREILVTILEEENLTVLAARTGADALATLDREMVDLVVLDLLLPDLEGGIVAKEIRRRHRQPRILAISASPTQLTVAAADGVDAILAKPFDLDELLEVVTQLCPAEPKRRKVANPPASPA
jgi:DNA-binding response OmpR family regulator